MNAMAVCFPSAGRQRKYCGACRTRISWAESPRRPPQVFPETPGSRRILDQRRRVARLSPFLFSCLPPVQVAGRDGVNRVKIAAIVGVKDERDLIQPCLERLWSVGVGPILVLDDHSSDGTLEIVDRLRRRTSAPLSRTTFVADFNQNLRLGGEVLAPFMQEHAPDWLLFIDADEFVICVDDNLQKLLARAGDPVLEIERFNVPLMQAPFVPASGVAATDFLGVHLITGREALSPKILEEDLSRRVIMHRILPKVVCRPDLIAYYGLGCHSVSNSTGQMMPARTAEGVIIAHLPMTTLDRFERKVENARHFFRRWADHYPGDAAWHWKRWVDLADRGGLGAEFEAQRMDEATFERLKDLGVLERADAVIHKSLRKDSML